MALADAYKQFLAAPHPDLLAPDASLVYVTTGTVFKGVDKISEHFKLTANKLQRDKQEALTVVEGHDAVVIEVDTTLKFLTSGGAYLPGLDDNFLSDRTVHLPITHVVTFDSQGKILQIRQSWDQGGLLKQCDVIGKSGRNWPIRDSTEQIRLIASSAQQLPASDNSHDLPVRARTAGNRPIRDPHELFAHKPEEDQSIESIISPKAGGTRPRQRSFTEILGDEPGSPSAGRDRSESSTRAVAPKIGAGKNFQAQRLFDENEDHEESDSNESSPNRFYRPHPAKFNHFEFGDATDPSDAVENISNPNPKKTKHTSQWDFEDFVTPAKPKAKAMRAQEVRHWGLEAGDHESPIRPPQGNKPRKDAETHFEFVDDGPESAEPRKDGPRGALHNKKLSLYQNNLYDEEGRDAPAEPEKQALGAVTNLKDRGRDFAPHFDMNDNSPAQKPTKPQTISDDRKKAVKMMDANWSSYDTSPAQKENKPERGIAIAGNGMGGGKGQTAAGLEQRGIAIGGDGMGGGKGSNREWMFGNDDQPEEKPVPGKKANRYVSTNRTFDWDF
ncbi:uncharacterized protein B0I36DRAFT_349280 [Microdochium trichocladiopsis]|uniref:NTF2 domain-containing protein n=1 Tax=Microdochium trichocladiopsis TaxID=1682393 RepID=A0A9P8Y6Q4_9PEZI|nr:uncharacterized protein B0I36DRAFT_349280 [Microdochium trichocladiopsis]KAH7031165.1 hypothetical protein B0I36DRAFT_349280 [Microdochium trichocladiopsis]